jgi:hypothetical protein
VEVPYGEGRLILVGMSLHNRAQMVANFKLLFNAIAGGGRSSAIPTSFSSGRSGG